jgi:NADH-quinone oxidoreductase subunit H
MAVSALATTLFLGGPSAPPGLGFTESWLGGWFTFIWFLLKVGIFFFFFVWLRGTLPRLRYDQFMKFGWKVLIPVNVAWILIVATLRLLTNEGASQFIMAGFIAVIVISVMLATSIYESSKARAEAAARYVPEMPEPSFPVPALPKRAELDK